VHALAGWISAAQHTLEIAIYDINLPDPVGAVLRDALAAAAARGVSVRLAYNLEDDGRRVPVPPPPKTVPELIESPPWASKAWARSEGGVGYSVEEADELAAQVVPAEILEYADVLRSHISQWLRAISDEELEAPNAMSDNVNKHNAYNRPAVQESLKPLVGQPVWLLLSITCYAHCWAHLEEIRLLTAAGRTARQ